MKKKNLLSLNIFYRLMICSFLLIAFNGLCRAGNGTESQQTTVLHGKWTWVSGDSSSNEHGVYGVKGIADNINKPGARRNSMNWIDSKDNLWLFGGAGYASTTEDSGYLNDLWKFDGANWIWVSGDNTANQHGIYDEKSIPFETNKPGARENGLSWIDSKDDLWLFNGYGYDRTGNKGKLYELWKYNGVNWTLLSGDSEYNKTRVYGIKGIAAATNKPGAREGNTSWRDSKGNLWLFGGIGYASKTQSGGYLNDLWKFDGMNWTWVSGSSSAGQLGVYGTKGVAAIKNKPGAREGTISWVDSKGNLWLFGGDDYSYTPETGNKGGSFNDLWKFDGINWTWVSGDSAMDQHGVYGNKGVVSATNKPGARHASTGWVDSKDNFWLFGGIGYAEKGVPGVLNDLWKFDGANWTWISGDSSIYQPGVYGDKGVASATNKPGARHASTGWVDSKDNLWLFGGVVHDSVHLYQSNDLWRFEP
jgi:hypothetical protein